MPFDTLWHNIQGHFGQEFTTITGCPFTYEAHAGYIAPSCANQRISRSDFEKAYELVPLNSPGQLRELVRGPSYVYAILTDSRITDGFQPLARS